MRRRFVFDSVWIGWVAAALWLAGSVAVAQRSRAGDKARGEQRETDRYRQWLDQDVVHIITEDERKVFEKLTTSEEKDGFIEQFWGRRDPDPSSAVNEYKEEHYRRLAYANERFSVGQPGWMTDRGRIYIIHGPPVEIEAHPTGGHYARPSWQGGGFSQAYPFEVWRYRHIEGVGPDVEIEFVDQRLTGQYRLAVSPEQKDALLQVGRSGPTLAEMLRLERKSDRPHLSYRNDRFQRAKDTPFERYATYVKIQAPPPIKFQDLKQLVQINVTYENLPLKVRSDYFRLNDRQVLVPITLQVENKDLTFKEAAGEYTADVAVYGIVTSLTHRVAEEFEDELDLSYDAASAQSRSREVSVYQKMVVLDAGMRYKVDLVVKDLNGGRVGVARQPLVVPPFSTGKLEASSLIVSDFIEPMETATEANAMFVLGDVRIRPSLTNRFPTDKSISAYLQIYHLAVDETDGAPSIRTRYRIAQEGKTLVEVLDESGQSVQFFSEQRMVLIRALPVVGLKAGHYELQIEIEDRIGGGRASVSGKFELY